MALIFMYSINDSRNVDIKFMSVGQLEKKVMRFRNPSIFFLPFSASQGPDFCTNYLKNYKSYTHSLTKFQ